MVKRGARLVTVQCLGEESGRWRNMGVGLRWGIHPPNPLERIGGCLKALTENNSLIFTCDSPVTPAEIRCTASGKKVHCHEARCKSSRATPWYRLTGMTTTKVPAGFTRPAGHRPPCNSAQVPEGYRPGPCFTCWSGNCRCRTLCKRAKRLGVSGTAHSPAGCVSGYPAWRKAWT